MKGGSLWHELPKWMSILLSGIYGFVGGRCLVPFISITFLKMNFFLQKERWPNQ